LNSTLCKEANRWEEQLHLGLDIEAQTEYGTAPSEHERILEIVRRAGEKFGQRKLASAADTSLSKRCQAIGARRFAKQAGVDAANLAKVLSGRRRFSETMRAKLEVALVGSEPIDTAFDQ
jgi:hypothetical protein